MSQELLTLPQVKEYFDKVPDAKFKRAGWDVCRFIRMPIDSDYDVINFDINGVIIEDCKAKVCDCTVGVWPFTPEDATANDYVRI